MIGFVDGKLERVDSELVLVNVNGVGYEVHCHAGTLAAMPPVGAPVRLHTHFELRQDGIRLYGFADVREREWFRLLTAVQGVGAKGANSILGTVGVAGLADAIALGDSSALKRAHGIGPRTATRVVNELRGRTPASVAMPAVGEAEAGAPSSAAQVHRDAVSALVNLGYTPDVASDTVREVMTEREGEFAVDEVILAALQRLGRTGG